MTTEKGQKIEEQNVETFKQGIVEPPQGDIQPPAADLSTLQQQLDELRTKYEQADKGLRSAQATLTQKDRLLKEKENYAKRLDSLEDTIQILAGAIAKENLDPEEANDYKKEFATLREKRKREEEEAAVRASQEEFIQKAREIYSDAEIIYGDDEDALAVIRNFIRNKDFDLAERKITKAKEKKTVDNKPADNITKRLEALEKENQKLKQQLSGSLDTETGLPSGAEADVARIRKKFREKPNDPDARREYMEVKKSGLIK